MTDQKDAKQEAVLNKCTCKKSDEHVALPFQRLDELKKAFASTTLDKPADFLKLLRTICVGEFRGVDGLEAVLVKHLNDTERKEFLTETVPFLQALVLDLPDQFPKGTCIPLLPRGKKRAVQFTRAQCASILACAYLCLLPTHLGASFGPEEDAWPNANFDTMHAIDAPQCYAKQRMFLHYFNRLRKDGIPKDAGLLTVYRHAVSESEIKAFEADTLAKDSTPLAGFEIKNEGSIEDAVGSLQADFANAYIGGGVLESGCVQEEIRFSINPECIVSMLICEAMTPTEAILIQGSHQYSDYSGYAFGLTFKGDHQDKTPADKPTAIVGIDAIVAFKRPQFAERYMVREALKAFAGFSMPESVLGRAYPSVATGNWGCGAFGGNIPLKAMLQWIAASKAGRSTIYYPFNDKKAVGLAPVAQMLLSKGITAGELFTAIRDCFKGTNTSNGDNKNLFDFLKTRFESRPNKPKADTTSKSDKVEGKAS